MTPWYCGEGEMSGAVRGTGYRDKYKTAIGRRARLFYYRRQSENVKHFE